MPLENSKKFELPDGGEQLIESKKTTQLAPLERFLNMARTRKIAPYVNDCTVLDFGCGERLRTLRAIKEATRMQYGIDSFFTDVKPHKTHDGIGIAGSFDDLRKMTKQDGELINRVLSLACFEHLESAACREVLKQLASLSTDDAILIGTVPTPMAKPILEFLSYRLGLIDRSQIEDHKVYYDKESFEKMIETTGWFLTEYRLFQFGLNSFFKLEKGEPPISAMD